MLSRALQRGTSMANRSRGRGQISELTHIAPIKQGFIERPLDGSPPIRCADRLRALLEVFHAREDQGFPSVIRLFRGLHTAQWALLDGDTRLMVNVVFDGTLHGYLRALARDIPGMLHMIWSNCEGWEPCAGDPQKLIDFIERHQVRVNFFYAQHPGLTVPDVENLVRLRDAVEAAADGVSCQQLQSQLHRANLPRSNQARLAGLLERYGDTQRSQQAFVELFASLYTAQELENAGRESYGGAPDLQPPAAADVERESKIQSQVLDPYERAHCGRMLFFYFPEPRAARAWLARQRERLSFGRAPGVEPYLNLGLSYPGLAALGLDVAALADFPAAFREGMDARAAALGDAPPAARQAGPSSPQRAAATDRAGRECWTGVFDPRKPVHAVLFVNCEPGAQLRAELLAAGGLAQAQALDAGWDAATGTSGDVAGHHGRLVQQLGAQLDRVCAQLGLERAAPPEPGAPELVGYQDLHRPLVESPSDSNGVYGIEYFGFRDGIGQPLLPQRPRSPAPAPSAGANELGGSGWLRERGSYDVVLRRDGKGLLKDASFLVARQLRQQPQAFWRDVQARAELLGTTKRELAEQMVGRRMNGRRLDSSEEHFDPERDRFAFDPESDSSGCPFHSHVRRANPRIETNPARNPQLMRRSLAYLNARGGQCAQGLMFLAFNADIESQFELIQRNWIQAGNQVGLNSRDRDPLAGQLPALSVHAPASAARFLPQPPAAQGSREVQFPNAFVALEWGLYLFFPARDALQLL